MENKLFPDPRGLALLALGGLYLLATPGVLAGFLDTYVMAPLQRKMAPAYSQVQLKSCFYRDWIHVQRWNYFKRLKNSILLVPNCRSSRLVAQIWAFVFLQAVWTRSICLDPTT